MKFENIDIYFYSWKYLPIPKGMLSSFFTYFPLESKNLSGWNSFGFGNACGFLVIRCKLGNTIVPLVNLTPFTSMSADIQWGRAKGAKQVILRSSWMTASVYGKLDLSFIRTCLDWPIVVNISFWTFFWTSGYLIMYTTLHDNAVDVVSIPAKNKSSSTAVKYFK